MYFACFAYTLLASCRTVRTRLRVQISCVTVHTSHFTFTSHVRHVFTVSLHTRSSHHVYRTSTSHVRISRQGTRVHRRRQFHSPRASSRLRLHFRVSSRRLFSQYGTVQVSHGTSHFTVHITLHDTVSVTSVQRSYNRAGSCSTLQMFRGTVRLRNGSMSHGTIYVRLPSRHFTVRA